MQLDEMLERLESIPRTQREQNIVLYALWTQRSILGMNARLERLQHDLKCLEEVLTLESELAILKGLEGLDLPTPPIVAEEGMKLIGDLRKSGKINQMLAEMPKELVNTLAGWVTEPTVLECLVYLAAIRTQALTEEHGGSNLLAAMVVGNLALQMEAIK